ncbi:MAG TPA: hypothetical protein PLW44_18655 [Chitinophagales bacterium]|nr:hypothetical protein [Chitinophagales bacterium]
MGFVRASLELINASDISNFEGGFIPETSIRKMHITALVESGFVMMSINETVKEQLGLKVRDRRKIELADGTVRELEVVGPIEVRFENRMSTVNAMVLPGNQEPLLGAIPMEEMDVLIHPNKE